ncbi:hypothetical protein BC826DRAFT_1032874, partial [Russula brevipes]
MFLFRIVRALPLVQRIMIAPQITRPNADTIRTPGNNELVTWYDDFRGFKGRLILRYQTADSENLDPPYASSLRDGSVVVACPTYIGVLFGDLGNASPQFTISSATNNSSGTPASSSGQPPSPEPTSSPAASTTSVPLSLMTLASTSSCSTPTSTPRPGTSSPSQEIGISTAVATSISPYY